MKLETFVGRLKNVKKQGRGFVAQCPAHEDKRASLSVAAGEKGIVLKCHAGCGAVDILDALGLKLKDLFPPKPSPESASKPAAKPATGAERGRIVAEYDYRDEAGQLLFQVVRFDPKDFRQRRPDADAPGGWNWSTAGVRRVLFRLPDVRRELDLAPERVVWICEGEKDVLELVKRGACATCNAGGAGKWQADYNAQLDAARHVVIVADKDEPGRKHAGQVAAQLARRGREVRVIESPTGKDVADFFAGGGRLEDLAKLADDAPPFAVPPTATAPGAPAPEPDAPLPQCVFDTGRQRYLIPAGEEWIPIPEGRMSTYLKGFGHTEFNRDHFGRSAIERAFQRIILEQYVSFAGQVAGYWPGVHGIAGQRMLVTRGPRLIEPKRGDWPLLRELMEELFAWPDAPSAEEAVIQWHIACEWLRTSYESLRARTFRPGLALCLCGCMGGGKSFFQGNVITPILGGRSANPYNFLTGKTDFNLDLVGAEHLTIDDDASERDHRSRQALGQKLKKLAVADTVSLHGKGRDAITVRTFCRVSICINDEPQDLMVLPPMEDSVKDKFALLKVRRATFPEMKDPEAFARFKAAITAELPAFLHWLLHDYRCPDQVKSDRFGVKNWQHPALIFDLEALHPWQRLMELVDHCRPWGELAPEWEGTVQDLEDALRKEAPERARTVLRGPACTGMDLNCALQRLPGRLAKRILHGRTVWVIRRGGA